MFKKFLKAIAMMMVMVITLSCVAVSMGEEVEQIEEATEVVEIVELVVEEVVPVMVKVTFVVNGTKKAVEIEKGQTIQKPANDPTLEGSKFLNWINKETNKEHDFHNMINEDITLLATFEVLPVVVEEEEEEQTEVQEIEEVIEEIEEETKELIEEKVDVEEIEEETAEEEAEATEEKADEEELTLAMEEKIIEVNVVVIHEGNKIHIGDKVTLLAQTEEEVQFQWQFSVDGGMSWNDIIAENAKIMDIVVTKENANYMWRVKILY